MGVCVCVCGWWLASVYYFPVEYIRDCSIWLQGTALKYIYSGVVHGGSSNYAQTSLPLPSEKKKENNIAHCFIAHNTSIIPCPTQRTTRSINQPNNPSSHQNLTPLPAPTSHQIKPLFISPSLPFSPYLASPQPQSPTCATHLQHERKPA